MNMLFERLQHFINAPATIQVLQFLVLLMALLWLLTGGFSFLHGKSDRRGGKRRGRHRDRDSHHDAHNDNNNGDQDR